MREVKPMTIVNKFTVTDAAIEAGARALDVRFWERSGCLPPADSWEQATPSLKSDWLDQSRAVLTAAAAVSTDSTTITAPAAAVQQTDRDELAHIIDYAKSQANIDGWGDEGAGYDYHVMADILLSRYVITPRETSSSDDNAS